jgi:hypothetical protein
LHPKVSLKKKNHPMKYVLMLMFALACFSCAKTQVAAKEELEGTWQWEQSSGGFAGMTIKASATDKRQMIFKPGNSFEFYQNGKLIVKTTYVIETRQSIYSQEKVPQIVFPKDDFMRMSYKFIDGKLDLGDEVYDGFSHTYVR